VECVVIFVICFECDGICFVKEVWLLKIKKVNIVDVCAMEISDFVDWVCGFEEFLVVLLFEVLGEILDLFVEIGLGYFLFDWLFGMLFGGEV